MTNIEELRRELRLANRQPTPKFWKENNEMLGKMMIEFEEKRRQIEMPAEKMRSFFTI